MLLSRAMLLVSIIIPHRNRHRDLELCLWSIERSACDVVSEHYEIIVVDSGSSPSITVPPNGRVIEDICPPALFNKPRCQNLGIEAAQGDVLSFLDADMLVGRHWVTHGAYVLGNDPRLTKLCYRVRQLKLDREDLPARARPSTDGEANPGRVWAAMNGEVDREHVVDRWFSHYERFTRCVETYGSATGEGPDGKKVRPGEGMPFGNSQFSIRRDVLGDLRFDEAFAGAGFEDIWMNREIARRADEYRSKIVTWPEGALLHICHERPMKEGSGWCEPEANRANERRYYRS